MKAAEKRHELQKNELAEWMGRHVEEVRPHLVPIVGISLLAVAVIIGLTIYFGNRGSASPAAWGAYFATLGERDPDAALKKVIETQPDNAAGFWAKQSLGDLQLAQAASMLFSRDPSDREKAKEKLTEAEGLFKGVIDSASDPLLLTRARYSLAKVYESQIKPEEARKMYEMIAELDGESAIGQAAAKDAKRLSNKRDVELLKWFATQTPKPLPPLDFNHPGGPGSDLPSRPNLTLPKDFSMEGIGDTQIGETPGVPGIGIGDKPLIEQKPEDRLPLDPATTTDTPTDKPAEPKTDEPKAAADSTDDAKSNADPKPADEKPTDEKPADEKSADGETSE